MEINYEGAKETLERQRQFRAQEDARIEKERKAAEASSTPLGVADQTISRPVAFWTVTAEERREQRRYEVARAAMQGILAGSQKSSSWAGPAVLPDDCAAFSVSCADALLAALAKPEADQ